MATFIVGDVHGWHQVFERLLVRIAFDPARDHLWLAGDLVNRGPDSLAMLRHARALSIEMGERFVAVLGNHDLHLLAQAEGLSKKPLGDLDQVLGAEDGPALLTWLRQLPLAHFDRDVLLVHAGLWPDWQVADALRWARRLEEALHDRETRRKLLRAGKDSRLERALFGLTSLRTCTAEGEPCSHNGPPAQAPRGCFPWFALPARRSRGQRIVFGHWAALGLYQDDEVIGLDSGCSWGGHLSALRLEDLTIFQEPNPDAKRRPQL